MTEKKAETSQTEEVEIAECKSVVLEQARTIEENKTMLDVKEMLVFTDRTYKTEYELKRFLSTLTESQLAHTEVIADDDTFVVFYPRLRQPAVRKSGFHFDTDSFRPVQIEAELPEWASELAPHSPERAAGMAVLLASVRL